MTSKKRKLVAVGLEQPLSIGTVTAKDLDEIERELLACDANYCDCVSSIRDSATDNTVVAITDAKGRIVSFVLTIDQTWSPGLLWVAPAFEQHGFGTMMSVLCDKLAASNEELLMSIEDVVDNEGFWKKQGYVRRQDLELCEVRCGPNMMFKLLLKIDLAEDDEAQGLLENHREFLAKPMSSEQVVEQLDLCWPESRLTLRVSVFMSVFNDGGVSDGVFAIATLNQGALIFANTMCFPIKDAPRADWTLAIHIISPEHPAPFLRMTMNLFHMEQVVCTNNVVLFNRIQIPDRCHMKHHPFPGVSNVQINTLARSLVGLPGVTDLRNSQNLMQLIAAHANKTGPWKVQLSL